MFGVTGVLRAATVQGYDDTLRRATLTEVSETLDVSEATVSDRLFRAEGEALK